MFSRIKMIRVPITLLLIQLFALGVYGCRDYKSELENKNSKIAILESKNIELKNEIAKLKETPQSYWNIAIEKANNGELNMAIEKLILLQSKFPNSELSNNAGTKIHELKSNDTKKTEEILKSVRKLGALESINLIKTALENEHVEANKEKLIQALNRNKALYKKQRVLIEAEKSTGIKVLSIESYWDWTRTLSGAPDIFAPHLKIKLKNTSNLNVKRLKVKATFVKSDGEVFGTDDSYVIGFSDTPLRPNQFKTAFLNSSIGYKRQIYNLPAMKAEIYINDVYYKNIKI